MGRNEENPFRAENIWNMVAVVCLMAAVAVWWWRGQADAAFVLATLGVVAWFVSFRQSLVNSAHTSNTDDTSNVENKNYRDQDEA